MDFQTRPIAKEASYLCLIAFPRLVRRQGKAFKHVAGNIVLLRLQTCYHVIREVDSNFHVCPPH